jgi:hypothetical protein
MGFVKKFGQKLSRAGKFGLKASKNIGFGIKSVAQSIAKYAPKVEQIAGVVEGAALATGFGPVAAAAQSVRSAAFAAERLAPTAAKIGGGLEKLGKKDIGGVKDLFEGGREAMDFR